MATVPIRSKRQQMSKLEQHTNFQLPSHKLQCFSVACLDMPHLEFGDKIVLPPKFLLELQCLKIQTPLLFMVRDAGLDNELEDNNLSQYSYQYCSVQEFSAPNDQVFLPYWLMQNLQVPEGGSVVVTSITNLPRGVYCRLQPETIGFLDLAAEIGPKLLMETALRRYSVLSLNSTIVIEYGDVRYYVRVVELKPAPVVSLCGDVDLETDFMPPEGSDPKRPSTGKSTASNDSTCVQSAIQDLNPKTTRPPDNILTSVMSYGYGRRLRDGGYVENTLTTAVNNTISSNENVPRKNTLNSLQKIQQVVRDKQSKAISPDGVAAVAAATDSPLLAVQLRAAQRAFSTPGCILGTVIQMESPHNPTNPGGMVKPNSLNNNTRSSSAAIDQVSGSNTQSSLHKCNLCLADVPSINIDLHTLRCIKNPAYHKFECLVCHEKVFQVNESRHQHCPDCTLLCNSSKVLAEHQHDEHTASRKCAFCGGLFTRGNLQDHLDNGSCDHVLVPCSLCGLAFKKKGLTRHFRMCSSRTEYCDVCKAYVKITEFETHKEQCQALPTPHISVGGRIDSLSCAPLPPRSTFSNQTAVECVYCLQGGFPSIAAVEHHVMLDCRIAKSFAVSKVIDAADSNQDDEHPNTSSDVEESHSEEIVRPILAQGRMRRKGDTNALHNISSSRSKLTLDNVSNNQSYPSTNFFNRRTPPSSFSPSMIIPPVRLTPQAGKLRKPKPRPKPQLKSLSQRTSKSVATPEDSRAIELRDLCISNDGTSQRALPAPSRIRVNTQARRRPAANLPRPGRLDKLA